MLKYLAAIQKITQTPVALAPTTCFPTNSVLPFAKPLKLTACPPLLNSSETGVTCTLRAPGQAIRASLRRAGAQRGLTQRKVLPALGMLASSGENAKWLHPADILFIFLVFPSPSMFKKFLETELYHRLHLNNPLLSSRAMQVTWG